tara:strand:+ start:2063 stop:2416 length:354 start_codon:yes stop_codon:yes gene_type:complete
MIFLLSNILFNLFLWIYLRTILNSLLVFLLLFVVKYFQLYYGSYLYNKIKPFVEKQFNYLENLDYKIKLEIGKFLFTKIQHYIFPIDINKISEKEKFQSTVFKTMKEESEFLNSLIN